MESKLTGWAEARASTPHNPRKLKRTPSPSMALERLPPPASHSIFLIQPLVQHAHRRLRDSCRSTPRSHSIPHRRIANILAGTPCFFVHKYVNIVVVMPVASFSHTRLCCGLGTHTSSFCTWRDCSNSALVMVRTPMSNRPRDGLHRILLALSRTSAPHIQAHLHPYSYHRLIPHTQR